MNDEKSLREELNRAAPRPHNDVDLDELVDAGLHSRRKRRATLLTSAAAVAAAGVTLTSVAAAGGFGTDRSHAVISAQSSTSSSSRHTDASNLAPIDGACQNTQYMVLINGKPLPNRDAPISLKAGATIAVQVEPDSGQLAISQGTAQLVPEQASTNLTATDTTTTVTGTADTTGAIGYQLPLLTKAGDVLPAGTYDLILSYTTPCADKQSVGGEMDLTAILS